MTDTKKVWMPDTFFRWENEIVCYLNEILLLLRNEKIARFHNILTPNLYIRVFPNGNVLYSIRWVSNGLLNGKKCFRNSRTSRNVYFPRDKARLFTQKSEIVTLERRKRRQKHWYEVHKTTNKMCYNDKMPFKVQRQTVVWKVIIKETHQ